MKNKNACRLKTFKTYYSHIINRLEFIARVVVVGNARIKSFNLQTINIIIIIKIIIYDVSYVISLIL